MPNLQYPTLRHLFAGVESGARLIDGKDFGQLLQLIGSADSDVHGPMVLKAAVNEVTSGEDVTLPVAVVGRNVVVVNSVGATINVRANQGDYLMIDGGPVSETPQAINSIATYYCYDIGVWTQGGGKEAAAAPDTSGFVDVAGDTMTGPLVLSGAPVDPLHAATKEYVDTPVSGMRDRLDALEARASELEQRLATLEKGTP